MKRPLVEVQGLRKSYGDRLVLDDVSFEVRAGEILGIAGLNGTGKTTTVEIVQGLRSRDRGKVLVAGVDPAEGRQRLRQVVGSQLQSSALPERMRVAEALRLFARLSGDVVDWRRLGDEWGLSELGRSAFGQLSGGQRQRLFIALALVGDPDVVFLDELTQSLDPMARKETWRLVQRVRDEGASVVLVTHDMDEAEHLCDRVMFLHEGRIAATGTPNGLIDWLGGPVRTRFSAPPAALVGLEVLPGVHAVTHDGHRAEILGDSGSVVRVAGELARRELAPDDFTVVRPSLGDVFVNVTGAAA